MPPVWIFANPGRGKRTKGSEILSRGSLAIEYVHAANGKSYRHDFKSGVTIEALPDGSVRMFRPDGRPIIRDF
jgi:hypothetical protein